MSGLKSIRSLASVLGKAIPVERHRLRKYSWLPDVLRLEGSVIKRIVGPVLTQTVFATAVATASEVYGYHFNLSNNVLPLISVVVGLLLVFRNSTSYDRYYEGRKDFAQLTATVRNLSRLIWVTVMVPKNFPLKDNHRFPGKFTLPLNMSSSKSDDQSIELDADTEYNAMVAKLTADKVRCLKLLLSFVFAVVHHLRNESGTEYDDYLGVLPPGFKYNATDLGIDKNTLQKYATYAAIDRGHLNPKTPTHHKHPSFHRGNSSRTEIEPVANQNTALLQDDHTAVEFRPRSSPASLPLPLIIAHEVSRLLYKFRRKSLVDPLGPAGFNSMNTSLSDMVNQMTALERVATTPIPISYGIHLKQCVSLYLFSLPFTLVTDMHWRMVPLVTMVSFTLMGIEGIANEIEMPFGKAKSDLPLDNYCAALKSEVEYIVERLPEGNEEDVDPFE